MGSFSTIAGGTKPSEIWAYYPRHLTPTYYELTVTHPTIEETLLTTPIALPYPDRPASPQLTISLGASRFPTLSKVVNNVIYQLTLYLGGRNTVSSQLSVSFDVRVNNAPAVTGSGVVLGNNFWTASIFVTNVNVGDTIQVYMWADGAGANYDYNGFLVTIAVITLLELNLLASVTYRLSDYTLTKGNPSVQSTTYLDLIDLGQFTVCDNQATCRGVNILPYTKLIQTVNGGRNQNTYTFLSHSSLRPYYVKQMRLGSVIASTLGLGGV